MSPNWTLVFVVALAACASGPSSTPTAKPAGPLVTAGTRCAGGECRCRAVDNAGEPAEPTATDKGEDPEGAPAAGQKRFELRTGRGLDPISITVDGRGTLNKSTERPEPSCGYIDLPPGQHRVVVRARAANVEAGMEPAFFVYEWSGAMKSWYRTFAFRCGGDGMCAEGHLEDWAKTVRATPRGLFDPCGSTKVQGMKWTGQKAPRGPTMAEVEVEFTLNVYPFEPRFPHGAPKCKGPSPSSSSGAAAE